MPSVRIAPQYEQSDGSSAERVLKAGRFILDPWQRSVLDDWMALSPDGLWMCGTCGLSVPRQNGKNVCIETLEFFGLL